MTREKFEALCRECCRQSGLSECLFADADVGFIDTSADCDGSRGIAFSKRKMMVNFDGTVKNVAYCKIRSVQIISSMEDAFADELEISGEHSRLRISDYSIDKLKLKQIIEGLCEGIEEKTAAIAADNHAEKAVETVKEATVTVKVKPVANAVDTSEKFSEMVGKVGAAVEKSPAANAAEISETVEEKEVQKPVENAVEIAETVEQSPAANVAEIPETVEEKEVQKPVEKVVEIAETVAEITEKAAETVEQSPAVNAAEIPETVEEKAIEKPAENAVEIAETVAEITEKAAETVEQSPAVNAAEIPETAEEKEAQKPAENAVVIAETVAEITEKAAETVEQSPAANAAEIPETAEEKAIEKPAETIADTVDKAVEAPEKVEETVEKIQQKVVETVPAAAENINEPTFGYESEIPVIAEQPVSEAYPVGEIEWLNGAVKTEEKAVTEEKIEWLSGMRDEQPPEIPENPTDTEAADRELIEQMSREETLDFLSKALSEINDEPASEGLPEIAVKPDTNALSVKDFAENLPEEKAPPKNGGLSKEPVWGDIYIKASRSLRELCESGRLSMDVIENELREKLLDSAKAFAQIIADEQKVPKTLLPKIAELKNAAANFDEYFAYGEDVGVRVMFFMLYQMLSYADRIAENPDTKEPLNDFFRRFGTAGITLSMLDVRG
ncbi:MAG: hypothetical protein ACI4JT_10010 [Oscillospiraceae bacterium]